MYVGRSSFMRKLVLTASSVPPEIRLLISNDIALSSFYSWQFLSESSVSVSLALFLSVFCCICLPLSLSQVLILSPVPSLLIPSLFSTLVLPACGLFLSCLLILFSPCFRPLQRLMDVDCFLRTVFMERVFALKPTSHERTSVSDTN